MLPDTIEIKLLARHFEGADFEDCYNGPINKAIAEQANASTSEVLDDACFLFRSSEYGYAISNGYSKRKFTNDAKIAAIHGYNDNVVRTILLIKTTN